MCDFTQKYNSSGCYRINFSTLAVEMAQAANGPVFGRAADDIFSGWTSPSRYEPPTDVEKNFKIFFLVERTTRWH